MLEVTGLSAGYGDTQILHGVDISAAAGQVVALLGPNGAGKSTLNKVLSGIIRRTAGSIVFDGADLAGAAPD